MVSFIFSLRLFHFSSPTYRPLQRIEWEAFVSERPPLRTLTAENLPQSGKEVPHRIYGWPITEEYLLQYARRHRLTFLVSSNHRARLEGKEEFNYGDLTDEDLMDESLALSIRRFATLDVMIHFLGEVGARLTFERPVSRTLDWMLVLWSTDDYEEKYARYKMRGNWEKIEKFIDNALNECLPEGCERRTSLEWWWSLQNTLVSSFSSVVYCCTDFLLAAVNSDSILRF